MKVKPPYRVPSMVEVAKIPHNGYAVASTFSGCGGSCLGYRMAGFSVLWANEFIPAAQETYAANHPDTILSKKDIRKVTVKEVLKAIGKEKGELDLLDGSPPCAAFSTAGKLSEGWGRVKKYSDTSQRVDDLFFEYVRLLKGLQPKVFVAENVSGLVKGVAKGYFKEILSRLKECGYKVSARVLDAKWLGVPQSRQRLIFIGVRDDLKVAPDHPAPLPYYYTIADALPWLSAGAEYVFDTKGNRKSKRVGVGEGVVPAITVSGGAAHLHHSIIGGPSNEEMRQASLEGTAIGKEWGKLKEGDQSDKYFNLVRSHRDNPVPTICASHGGHGVAGVVHPEQKRKFYISELKRLCAFPDDFILTGSYKQQWERLGRAVPPLMMKAIAEKAKELLDQCAA